MGSYERFGLLVGKVFTKLTQVQFACDFIRHHPVVYLNSCTARRGQGARSPDAMPPLACLGGADLIFTINNLNEPYVAVMEVECAEGCFLLREHVL